MVVHNSHPRKQVSVLNPLLDELDGDGLVGVGDPHLSSKVEQRERVVVEGGNHHLQTHLPQLRRLHLPGQPRERELHKQRHNLTNIHNV